MDVLYWPKDWISDEAAICRMVTGWQGFHAQVWEYVVSHGQLMLRLYGRSEGFKGNCYLYCKGCDRVEFDARWKDAALEVSVFREICGGKETREFTITDGTRLLVRCRALFAVESDHPIWLQRPPELTTHSS